MKKLIPVFAVLCTLAAPALAGPCVALDYQEMKDMSADELIKEACNVRWSISQNLKDEINNVGSDPGRAPSPNASDNFQQCMGQAGRIERVLESKGMSKTAVSEICEAKNAELKARLDRLLQKR